MNILVMKHIIKINTQDWVLQKKITIMLMIEDQQVKENQKKDKLLAYILLEIIKQIYKNF